MSTLEKAILLLESMPEDKIETVYTFIQFVDSRTDGEVSSSLSKKKSDTRSAFAENSFVEALKSDALVIPTDLGNNAAEYVEGLRTNDRV